MKSKIEYQDAALVITLPCTDPAALHAQLMRSITAGIHYASAAKDKASNYLDEIEPIITLLKCLLPGERELMKAYQ